MIITFRKEGELTVGRSARPSPQEDRTLAARSKKNSERRENSLQPQTTDNGITYIVPRYLRLLRQTQCFHERPKLPDQKPPAVLHEQQHELQELTRCH